jgi:hypothetical protein
MVWLNVTLISFVAGSTLLDPASGTVFTTTGGTESSVTSWALPTPMTRKRTHIIATLRVAFIGNLLMFGPAHVTGNHRS